MCNQLIGAPVVVVTAASASAVRLRTVAPFGLVARQESVWRQLGTATVAGMRRPMTADLPTYAPKHAPSFALSGLRTCDPPV
jgi:hypothetical protein